MTHPNDVHMLKENDVLLWHWILRDFLSQREASQNYRDIKLTPNHRPGMMLITSPSCVRLVKENMGTKR